LINVSLNKDWYLPGEKIDVQVTIDNSKGEQDLEGFSVKLVRQITA
jgi:sporulation-control protein spo0M